MFCHQCHRINLNIDVFSRMHIYPYCAYIIKWGILLYNNLIVVAPVIYMIVHYSSLFQHFLLIYYCPYSSLLSLL